MWRGPDAANDPLFRHSTDVLAASLYRRDFESKALRLLKMARAALIYLSLAIHSEEAKRERERPQKGLIVPAFLATWDHQWTVYANLDFSTTACHQPPPNTA